MHFSATLRPNPTTGQNEPYYRLKETYRDEAGIVRSRILLSPGFIKGLSGEQLRSVSIGLTYRMEHKNECDLFDESMFSYEQPVRELIESLWKMLVSQNKVDVDITKDRLRIEKERNLLCAETIENKEAREMGAEWSCYQAINQLDIASFLLDREWDEGLIYSFFIASTGLAVAALIACLPTVNTVSMIVITPDRANIHQPIEIRYAKS